MKFLAIIYDGFEEEEAVASFALLRRANQELTIASDNKTVKGAYNMVLANVELLDDIDYKDYDCLLLPGGPHWKKLKVDSYTHQIIKYFMDNDKFVAAICASPTILGSLGYLKGKSYTCYTSMNEDFGGTYIDTKVVVDNKLITGRSVDASIDFAYKVIETVCGEDILNTLYKRVYHS